ncbi:hypothetical protein DKX38_011900 [Salix brachista]|uniref:Aminotransferase-like plant mobile domain-containing protein n=1 Tax=Salix brachista TaxID=2182728 RepID=A0A5N5LZV9_9ROSI|nr:hypothetical protein DKX38_011900 [Salix brachista]
MLNELLQLSAVVYSEPIEKEAQRVFKLLEDEETNVEGAFSAQNEDDKEAELLDAQRAVSAVVYFEPTEKEAQRAFKLLEEETNVEGVFSTQNEDDKDKVIRDDTVWIREESRTRFLVLEDLFEILNGKAISNLVIDVFSCLLLEDRGKKEVSAPKVIIHDSSIWEEIPAGLPSIGPCLSLTWRLGHGQFYNSWFKGKINDFNFVQDAEMVKEYVHKRRQELLGTEETQKADDPFQLIVKEDCPQQKDFSISATFQQDAHLIEALLDMYSVNEDVFKFENFSLYLGLEDVLYITGLPIDGEPVTCIDTIDGDEECNKFLGISDCINHKNKIRNSVKLSWLNRIFEQVPGEIDEDSPNFVYYVRAYALFLIGTIILPDASGHAVQTHYLQFLEKIEDIGKYA